MNKTYGGLVSEPQNYKKGTHVGGDTTYTFGGTITTTDVVIPGGDTPEPHDYSKDYFTTVALEDGTISFNIWKNMGTDYITSISYSTDNGATWTTTNNVNDKEENLQITVSVNEGDRVLWKGVAKQLGYWDENWGIDDSAGSFFSSTASFDAEGNVMSMLYGDDFVGETTISEDYTFFALFYDYYNGELECNIVDASNMVLPATTLAQDCYNAMFRNCTSLTAAPELPATTLAVACYRTMFEGCTSLQTTPELPATTLAELCYNYMFEGCTSLNSITCLATDISASECTIYWLYGVDSNGTFTKAASMTGWTTGANGIPTNWTVVDAE